MALPEAAAVIFDLDDTLYAERDFALSGFRAAAEWARRELGIDGLAADMVELLDAGHLGGLFALALARHRPDHTAEELQGLVAAYRDHVPEIALFDDARRVLDSLAVGPRLGLITDGAAQVQHAKIAALAIRPRFAHVIATDELGGRGYFKPHPLAFERMQALLALAPARLVYVGDNPAKDFLAPNALGWITVQVARPAVSRIHANARAPEGGEAQHVIASLDELPDLVVDLIR